MTGTRITPPTAPNSATLAQLPYAYGGPPLTARLRATAEDFVVDENLGFEPSGEGEHVLLHVRKRGINTDWLAGQIANFAGVHRNAVSYAGLKDRHAVTTQTFSVQLPGREDPDWSAFPEPDVDILGSTRHLRKLRRGALVGNAFSITLREVSGDLARVDACLSAMAGQGVPNYFGEQRFGREGRNSERAVAFFQGRKVSRKQQGMLISAARSQIFNDVLARRVQQGNWNRIIDGEVCCLNGSHSWFLAESDTAELVQRAARFDIHPSGPLWGSDELPSRGEAAAIEQQAAAQHPVLTEGLGKQRMDHGRRPLRLRPDNLRWEWVDSNSLRVAFDLPAGSYATVLLRELVDWYAAEPAG